MTHQSLEAVAFDETGRSWQLEVRAASALSLAVVSPSGQLPPVGTVFARLVITWHDTPAVMGRCKLTASRGGPPVLVFTEELPDVRGLFSEGRAKNQLSMLNELGLVLSQRKAVKEPFRSFVADVIYDLTVYRKALEAFDRTFSNETREVVETAQDALLNRVAPDFFKTMDGIIERMSALVRNFTPEEHELHGYYFRQQLWTFLMGAEFMRRTNLKPRGYPGDAVMMEMLYDDAFEGSTLFNKLLHRHPVKHAAAQAVRNRRVLVPAIAHEHLAKSKKDTSRVLSVACGPARELEQLFRDAKDAARLDVTLLDQDEEALSTAARTVRQVEAARGTRLNAHTVNTSVRMLLRERDTAAKLGRFDFIYSMGMFDYLTPPVARAVLARLYELLEPGGALLVGNYHVDNASRFYMAYWLDWQLYYRSEDEMNELAATLPGARTSLQLDDTRCQMFLTVEKPIA
ncbi:MAG: class I SAM-dependent methyltransferase [Archangium sp.]